MVPSRLTSLVLSGARCPHSLDPLDRNVVGAPAGGRKFVILGDTCDSTAIASCARGATLLIHEVRLHPQSALVVPLLL